MRPLGYVRRSRLTRVDCQQPLRFLCRNPACGYAYHARCRCSDELKCIDCSERQRKLLVRLINEGASARVGGYWYMATLNAPGDPQHTRFVPGVRGNHGPCSCGQHGLTMGEWNALESRWWNRLRTALSREVDALAYVGTVEVQKRGALHRHLLIWSSQPIPTARAQELALAAGYGCALQWQKPYSANSAAEYVAKYITKSSGQRGNVPWEVSTVDLSTGLITTQGKRATYRTWSRSQAWGVTMQGLRDVMAAQAKKRAAQLALSAQPATDAGSLAPDSAGHVHMTGPPG